MGQYFKAVNLDKKEFVCPWCICGGAKLWEWAANWQGGIFTLLLRQSTEGGGGDYKGETFETDKTSVIGRWAGDRVTLVGDYDASQLFQASEDFRNVSGAVVQAWGDFIKFKNYQLRYVPCPRHNQPKTTVSLSCCHP